jgi:hypothetical protein
MDPVFLIVQSKGRCRQRLANNLRGGEFDACIPPLLRFEVRDFARTKLADFYYVTARKKIRREKDEGKKPLESYRQNELRQMYNNFYIPNSPYHAARAAFVKKQPACWSPLSAKALEQFLV